MTVGQVTNVFTGISAKQKTLKAICEIAAKFKYLFEAPSTEAVIGSGSLACCLAGA